MWQDYFQLLIKQKYQKAKAQNKSFSMRAFAQKIGVGRGDISELISGKRRISQSRALKISEKLHLTQSESNCLLELIKNHKRIPRHTLSSDQDFILKSRLYLSLLLLLEFDRPPANSSEVAKILNLSEKEVDKALEILLRRGLIEKKENYYRMVQLSLKTTEDIPNEIYRKALEQDFQLGKEAIWNIDPKLRECTSITFAGSTKVFTEIREEIRQFRDKISILGAKENKDQIYNLTIGFIPLLNQKEQE